MHIQYDGLTTGFANTVVVATFLHLRSVHDEAGRKQYFPKRTHLLLNLSVPANVTQFFGINQ